MSKVRAPKERVVRKEPRPESTLEPAKDTPSMAPPAFSVLDGSETAAPKKKESSKEAAESQDQAALSELPQVQILARGSLSAGDIPRLPVDGGEVLDGEIKSSYEEAMGVDLSQVRIHADAEAQNAVKALGAEALTHRNDIYLSKEFKPGDPQSERALAHELLHVKQFQSGRIPSADSGAVSSPQDPLEQEAYGQENEIAKAALEQRGESTDSPILNSPFTPPVVQQPQDGGGDASEEFAAMDQELGNALETEGLRTDPTNQAEDDAAPNPEVSENLAGEQEASTENAVSLNSEPPVNALPSMERPASVAQSGSPVVESPSTDVPVAAEIATYQSKPTADAGEEISVREEAAKIKQLSHEKAAALRASGAAKLAAYRQASATAKSNLRQKASAAKQAIQGSYQAQIQALQASAAAQMSAVQAAASAQKSALLAFGESEIQRYDAAKTKELSQAQAIVEAKKAATIAAAETAAARASSESEMQAQSLISTASGFPMGGEPDANEAKRKALTDIAQDASKKIRENGSKVAMGVLKDANTNNAKYDEAYTNFEQSLVEKSSEFLQNARELANSSAASIDQASSQAQAAITATLSQGTQAMRSASSQACSQVDLKLDANLAQLDAAETRISSGFQTEITQAVSNLTNYGEACSSQLGAADGHDVAGVQSAVQGMQSQITQYASDLDAGFATWLSQSQGEITAVEQSSGASIDQIQLTELASATTMGTGLTTEITNASVAANNGMLTLVQETKQSISSSTDEMIGSMAEARSDLETKLEALLQQATEKFENYVTEGLQAGQKLADDAQRKMSESVAKIGSEYSALKSEAQAKNGQVSQRIMRGFWSWVGGIIDSVVTWFKEKFFDWFKGFIIGVLKALAVVLVIAVIIFFLPELAIVLLVGGILLAIYARWQEYKADHNGEGPGFWWGVGLVALGILDITGIPFMIEGIAGQRATGGILTTEESGERFGMGLVFLITLGLAGYKGLRGGKGPKVPVEDPLRVPIEDPARLPIERPTEDPIRSPEERLPEAEPEERLPEGEPEERLPEGEPEERLPEGEPEERLPEEEPEERLPEGEPEERLPEGEPEERLPDSEELVPEQEPEKVPEDPNKVGISAETEAAFRGFLANKKFKLDSKEIETIITQMRKRPGAERLMNRIMNGDYADMEGFGKVLSTLKQSMKVDPDLIPKVEQTLDAADVLRSEGHDKIFFERSTDQVGYDADVGGEPHASVSANGRGPVVVQLKYVQNLKGIASNVTKGCSQLVKAPEGTTKVVEVLVKDGKLADFMSQGREQGILSIKETYPDTEIRIIFSDGQIKVY